jgi:uncharacterized protein YbjT (DUF2867 family)
MTRLHPNILSIGASGKHAGLVVPELVRHGARVRGFIRDPSKRDEVLARGASEVAIGDLRDSASLDAALEGIEGVFHLCPAFHPDETQLGLNVVDSAKRAGVKRFVFSSVLHPQISGMKHHIAKLLVEDAIKQSGMEYTVLQPASFYQNMANFWPAVVKTKTFSLPIASDKAWAFVDYRDVAEIAALALTSDRLVYGTFELCCEDNLNRERIATIMSEVLHEKIAVESPSFSTWAARNRLPYSLEPGPAKMFEAMNAYYNDHGFPGNSLILRAILGREPRSLKSYLYELARGV